jgi:hypothetical protein
LEAIFLLKLLPDTGFTATFVPKRIMSRNGVDMDLIILDIVNKVLRIKDV